MINQLLYHLHKPERGWDPVPAAHLHKYAQLQWDRYDSIVSICDRIEERIGTLKGQSVLDLGGGPGQFSIELAKRGAHVTWHDVSRGYREFTMNKLSEPQHQNLLVAFSLGYLEDVRQLDAAFDFVLCRLCWKCCLSDHAFGRLIYDMTKPGGDAYVIANHTGFSRDRGMSWLLRFFTFLNERFSIKIRHPYPSPTRFRAVFHSLPFESCAYQEGSHSIEVWAHRAD